MPQLMIAAQCVHELLQNSSTCTIQLQSAPQSYLMKSLDRKEKEHLLKSAGITKGMTPEQGLALKADWGCRGIGSECREGIH